MNLFCFISLLGYYILVTIGEVKKQLLSMSANDEIKLFLFFFTTCFCFLEEWKYLEFKACSAFNSAMLAKLEEIASSLDSLSEMSESIWCTSTTFKSFVFCCLVVGRFCEFSWTEMILHPEVDDEDLRLSLSD